MDSVDKKADLLYGRACFLKHLDGGMDILQQEIEEALRDVKRETAEECQKISRKNPLSAMTIIRNRFGLKETK